MRAKHKCVLSVTAGQLTTYLLMCVLSRCRSLNTLSKCFVFLQQEHIDVMNDTAQWLTCILRGKKSKEPDIGSYCITMLHID